MHLSVLQRATHLCDSIIRLHLAGKSDTSGQVFFSHTYDYHIKKDEIYKLNEYQVNFNMKCTETHTHETTFF